jgi:hypothetical protein
VVFPNSTEDTMQGDARPPQVAERCALLYRAVPCKLREWGFWSRLRFHLFG